MFITNRPAHRRPAAVRPDAPLRRQESPRGQSTILRSVFKISNVFLRPRPWQFEI